MVPHFSRKEPMTPRFYVELNLSVVEGGHWTRKPNIPFLFAFRGENTRAIALAVVRFGTTSSPSRLSFCHHQHLSQYSHCHDLYHQYYVNGRCCVGSSRTTVCVCVWL